MIKNLILSLLRNNSRGLSLLQILKTMPMGTAGEIAKATNALKLEGKIKAIKGKKHYKYKIVQPPLVLKWLEN
jgi:hypothetical protein